LIGIGDDAFQVTGGVSGVRAAEAAENESGVQRIDHAVRGATELTDDLEFWFRPRMMRSN